MTVVRDISVGVRGGSMAVRRSDPRPGLPPLLMVHGLGDSGLVFAEAFEEGLGDSFNLVVPDNLGCGRSSAAADGDYRLASQADRLRELAVRLDLEEIRLVGHSLGGGEPGRRDPGLSRGGGGARQGIRRGLPLAHDRPAG